MILILKYNQADDMFHLDGISLDGFDSGLDSLEEEKRKRVNEWMQIEQKEREFEQRWPMC
jgi:hypothetical protein